MSEHPEYVTHAFNAIRVISTEEWLQEDIEAFTQRWGSVDLTTFERVLHHAYGDDQIVAAFAIGHTRAEPSEATGEYDRDENAGG